MDVRLALSAIALLSISCRGGAEHAVTPNPEPAPAPRVRPSASTPIVAASSASAPIEDTAPPERAPTDPSASPYPPAIGTSVVERGHGPARRASTAAACRACNGSWGPQGLAGQVGCICGTHDGGKACKSPLDCEAECFVDDPDAYRGVRCGPAGCNGPEPQGHCARLVTSFGCNGRIVEMPVPGGVVREVHVICLD